MRKLITWLLIALFIVPYGTAFAEPTDQIFTSFSGGEVSPRLLGRPDGDFWDTSGKTVENFMLYSTGAAQTRPGTEYVGSIINGATKQGRLMPFVVSETVAYVLEWTENTLRIYTDDGADGPELIPVIHNGNSFIEHTYTEDEIKTLQMEVDQNIGYIVQENHAPAKLVRLSESNWFLTDLGQLPPPTSETAYYPQNTLFLNAAGLSGDFRVAWLDYGDPSLDTTDMFLSSDVGKTLVAGQGKAEIVYYNNTSEILLGDAGSNGFQVVINILEPFEKTKYLKDEWYLLGSPSGQITPTVKRPKNGYTTLTETEGSITALAPTYMLWVLSGSGSNEYYYNSAIPSSQPIAVTELGRSMGQNLVGTLQLGQWGWGDNDAIGSNRIYVRLTDETNPNTKTAYAGLAVGGGSFAYSSYIMYDTSLTNRLWRANDINSYVRIHNGIVYITNTEKISSAQYIVNTTGQMVKEIDSTNATYLWSLEQLDWSVTNGYPRTVVIHENRLCFGGSLTFPNTVWCSVTNEYENFLTGVNDADALRFTPIASISQNIRWMYSRNGLLIGTDGSEFIVQSSGPVLTPSDISAKRQTANGSEKIEPVLMDSYLMYVQRHARKVREISFEFEVDSYISPDRTLLADHITDAGFGNGLTYIDYQGSPISTMWATRADGELIGFTYKRDQNIAAWHRHTTEAGAGEFESIAIVPHPTMAYDQIWAIVKRTVNGSTVRYIEVFHDLFNSDDASDSWQLDSAIGYSGVSTTTLTGLSHLEAKSVTVTSMGNDLGEFTVSSGQITVPALTNAVVGLQYTATLQKMPVKANIGSFGQAKDKTIPYIKVRLHNSLHGKLGPNSTDIVKIIKTDETDTSTAPTLFTGDRKVNVRGGSLDDWTITVVQDKPAPLTVLALMPNVEYNGPNDPQ